MAILTHSCPTCGKRARIQSEFAYGDYIYYTYQCGHLELREPLKPLYETPEWAAAGWIHNLNQISIKHSLNGGGEAYKNLNTFGNQPTDSIPKPYDGTRNKLNEEIKLSPPVPTFSYKSLNGQKELYPFQVEGVKFAESTNLNCLIADQMTLGKTIQTCALMRRNLKSMQAVLILVKGSTIFQWTHEIKEWVCDDFDCVVPVISRDHLIPGFKIYVMSMDLLSRKSVLEKLLALNLKSVILDEVQSFKDDQSDRSRALIKLLKFGNIQFKIALSGTPIKNRASEYFTILNILAPQYFSEKMYFKRRWLIPNEKGIYTRLNPLYADEFKQLISRWVIRRERSEVFPDLPPLTRDYQIIEIEDLNIRKSYNSTLDLFANFMRNMAQIKSQDILGWLAKLRSITGQAKCKNAIAWINDFVESTDEQILIGIQHHAVKNALDFVFKQNGMSVDTLSGEDNSYAKAHKLNKFNSGETRILVMNIIAGGVGTNILTCKNSLVLERMWNSADEQQFEYRLRTKEPKTVTYLIARGTIDEFFHQMVMNKAKILNEAGLGSDLDLSNDIDSLKELSEMVIGSKI